MFRPDNLAPARPEQALAIAFQQGELISDLRSAQGCLLPLDLIGEAAWIVIREQFLGYWHEQACYALEIDPAIDLDPMRFTRGNLYQILGQQEDAVFNLVGRAAQLLAWEKEHQFCGSCGRPTELDSAERAMRCRHCRSFNYPRISPCIIVLVTRGEELLLARNTNFPYEMYSTLAGFIEAGETPEETLIREVREEVSLEVCNIRYFRSQSWPFPNQLMLGFFADYAGGDIVCDLTEIADAQWFHYRDLPTVPPAHSVAGQLIRHQVALLTQQHT
ncbi:NAD(+) diphosphatase [Parahaliea sp. F7430]|uniref:NAD(+) diphosphatase n=1 Tax=Sediminihaliea albiluteola TaxID=2758564 RepID=A0A7W2TUJ1_9GAMM|nr:NAD(+) diphosphatase [Sediminihaliea albiluteola]MBA6412216.1 NAD(+) diphosphatase [Sediminihaliea albiluteola]